MDFLLAVLNFLKPGYGVYKTIENLSNKMVPILEKSGDIHFKVASSLLRDVADKNTKQPKREFDQAIHSLRTAYDFFVSAGDVAKILWADEFNGKATSYAKAFATALLIAACYGQCKEARLEKDFLEKAKSCFSAFSTALISQTRLDDLNGLNLISMTRVTLTGDSPDTKVLIDLLEQIRQDLNMILRSVGIREATAKYEYHKGMLNR
jgi:hypothetical protein